MAKIGVLALSRSNPHKISSLRANSLDGSQWKMIELDEDEGCLIACIQLHPTKGQGSAGFGFGFGRVQTNCLAGCVRTDLLAFQYGYFIRTLNSCLKGFLLLSLLALFCWLLLVFFCLLLFVFSYV